MGALSEQIAEALRTWDGLLRPDEVLAAAAERRRLAARLSYASQTEADTRSENLRAKRLEAERAAREVAELVKERARLEAQIAVQRAIAEAERLANQAREWGGRARCAAIIKLCAERFGFSVSEILSGRRRRPLTRARQAAMWISHEATARSFPELGRAFRRDHTTIMHAIRHVPKHMAADPEWREKVMSVLAEVTG